MWKQQMRLLSKSTAESGDKDGEYLKAEDSIYTIADAQTLFYVCVECGKIFEDAMAEP